ncbi:MAG: hypothetical protein EG825_16730, partial [Rhodocyclaceae bacterium]|nr:hypothetical protein [Rhodocyclaceae bacterium]
MNETLLKMIVPAIGLISGLVATYVSLQNRALLAEVRRELAEMESRVIIRLNGTYERHSEAVLRDARVHGRID